MKKRMGSGTALLPKFGRNLGRDIPGHPVGPLIGSADLVFDFLTIVKVVGQCGVDVRERDARKEREVLLRTIPPPFVPGDDIGNADAVADNARAAAAYALMSVPSIGHPLWAAGSAIQHT